MCKLYWWEQWMNAHLLLTYILGTWKLLKYLIKNINTDDCIIIRHCDGRVWPRGIGAGLRRNRLRVRQSWVLVVSDTYPMFIELMIIRVPLVFSGYIWLDMKNRVEKQKIHCNLIPANCDRVHINMRLWNIYGGAAWGAWRDTLLVRAVQCYKLDNDRQRWDSQPCNTRHSNIQKSICTILLTIFNFNVDILYSQT